MGSQPNKVQIDTYRTNGYVVVNGLLDASVLAYWRQSVDCAIAEHLRQENTHHNQRSEDPDDYYKNVFVQCVNLWKSSEAVKNMVLDTRLGYFATELAGTDGVRLYHDHAMVKQPWANPTNFHVDNPYDPFYSHQAIMLWIALDDVTVQNGCLYFLPGTHKSSRFDVGSNLSQPKIGELLEEYPEWEGIEPQAVEMKAGDGVFISGMVAHAAGPNMTTQPRRAFAMLYMPENAVFNGKKSALPQELYERLNSGDILADDEHLPLVFSHRNL